MLSGVNLEATTNDSKDELDIKKTPKTFEPEAVTCLLLMLDKLPSPTSFIAFRIMLLFL